MSRFKDTLNSFGGVMKKRIGQIYDNFLEFLQPPSIELSGVLSGYLGSSNVMADLGCGEGNHLRLVRRPSNSHWIGVDSHSASLRIAKDKNRYDTTVCENVIEWLVRQPTSSVHTVLASCVIEHLDKELGLAMLAEMKRVCSVQAIVFTPNGFVPQPGSLDNPANAHCSGWTVGELNRLGYKATCGLYGLRGLRTSFGLPTLKPEMLGDFVAKSTSRLVFHLPRLAYQIVAVYTR